MKAEEFQRLFGHGLKPKAQAVARPAIRMPRTDRMSKVEAEYGRMLRTEFSEFHTVLYEAFSLRLPQGTLYTPDWVVMDGRSILLLVECKGAYRLHSAGASHEKYKSAVAAFPMFTFRFAQKSKDGWNWLNSNDKIPR